ncbi:oxygen-insensitive NADPH nitroreductase [Salinicoccus halodurans]|uniref:NADPH-dependent oxidoreductase n=1 Tax=Salinicoccus halodurans TaxID=407035 RepID=A0A0F7HN27_9STAP|nr:oxygen-insensitive NADPH nitroreductase [Salinicoccus halodurans]AKG74451.1 NADPH-dependent oxidoreductase [Salinicoccus halodurans]SFK96186.1 FMN reductase (NADPH) [Salinicoccus halodurans]
MNETIDILKNHRSIRKFKDEKLDQETIRELVESAQSASTSSYVQAYTIIGVTDDEKKRALKEISTQSYVENNGHLFVFLADYNRHYELSKDKGTPISYDKTEQLIVGTVDATLAAQNLAVAAESMGLGMCYIGSLRNDMGKVVEILGLPKGVIPLFGMVVGKPDHEGSRKERLPFDVVYHENTYKSVDKVKDDIEEYDERISEYYKERSGGRRNDTWSDQVIGMLSKKQRLDVDAVIKGQGFLGQ